MLINLKQFCNGKSGAFLLGILSTIGLVLLTGAVETSQTVIQHNRYQLSSWGTQVGTSAGVFGAFVMDTNTGETKIVYAKVYGEPNPGKIVKDDLGKAYATIQ